MNESEFESQLRATRPAAPSDMLEHSIANALRQPTIGASRELREPTGLLRQLLGGLTWATGGATAAVLGMLWLDAEPKQTPTGAGPSELKAMPAGTFLAEAPSREVVNTSAGALVFPEEQQPARLVRVNMVERRTWANAATGARIGVELPREDLMLIPVSYQ